LLRLLALLLLLCLLRLLLLLFLSLTVPGCVLLLRPCWRPA
jgi:hypothetical protein